MSDTLVVLLGGRRIGTVNRDDRLRLKLVYDAGYLDDPRATPLSVSMPLPVPEHGDDVVSPWLWGLLPDNADVLARWATRFGTSAASAFSLLATQVGRDCAGAVQFCPPAEIDDLLVRPGSVDWLTESDVAARLRELRSDTSTWLGRGFTGQFSLGGAQAKTALRFAEGRWGVPSGSTPTTHILKPAIPGLDGHDLNEHLCLSAARRLGLPSARSEIVTFDDETALVVERYDRQWRDGASRRVHQEDLCQAMSIHPARKYQAEGGPSALQIVQLFRTVMPRPQSTDSISRFVDGLILNWLIGGTDAHGKNYSLLLAGPAVRLAPLYDIASALPYDDSKGHDLRLAMKLGGEYRLLSTDRRRAWEKVAIELDLNVDRVIDRVLDLAARLPEALAAAAADPAVAALDSTLPARLVSAASARATRCARLVAHRPSA